MADPEITTTPAPVATIASKLIPITLDDFIQKQFPNLLGEKKKGARRRRFAPMFTRAALANLRRLSGFTATAKVLTWFAFQRGYRLTTKQSTPPQIRQMRFGHPVKVDPPFRRKTTGQNAGKLV